ncbi:hypothetical protein IEQ34_009627 [Dendrobium chrysotoxum]|uniref:Uncharacterized protein n=1 Tax=Dendrobium chrysotoxum TaxID=161865 RepID=A0AAV7H168_DENCH|nr:hypothetical protein IEQ34_009627 [Dendrobium chrysotoxum]
MLVEAWGLYQILRNHRTGGNIIPIDNSMQIDELLKGCNDICELNINLAKMESSNALLLKVSTYLVDLDDETNMIDKHKK